MIYEWEKVIIKLMGDKTIDRFKFNRNAIIGKGSFGEVFKGYEEESKMPVAVKMIPKQIIKQDKYLEDGLMSEIKIMQKLKSPNVVQLFQVLETENNYYFV